jgi:DNA polymerase/3'-5' exonuclease PolX
MDNRTIARKLLDWAHSLEGERANFYRVKAYRRAAQTVLGLDQPVEDLVAGEGRKGLKALPGIGGRMSEKIEKLVRTGDIATLKEDSQNMVHTSG